MGSFVIQFFLECASARLCPFIPTYGMFRSPLPLCTHGIFRTTAWHGRINACFSVCLSYTFQQVQEHTDQIWKFQRHYLIEEYHCRPAAPPPFILLNHLQLFVKRVILRKPAVRHRQLSKLCWVRLRQDNIWAQVGPGYHM